MRRTKEGMKKLRIKIIKLKGKGLTIEEIRRKTGASPNTIWITRKQARERSKNKVKEKNIFNPTNLNLPTPIQKQHENIPQKL